MNSSPHYAAEVPEEHEADHSSVSLAVSTVILALRHKKNSARPSLWLPLVRRLREADKKIETLALLDVYGRVARVLLDMSEKVGEERMVRSRLPRQEIAKMIGASREMVSRVMKGLETEGYIVPLPEGKVLLREKLSSYLA